MSPGFATSPSALTGGFSVLDDFNFVFAVFFFFFDESVGEKLHVNSTGYESKHVSVDDVKRGVS